MWGGGEGEHTQAKAGEVLEAFLRLQPLSS